MRGIRGESKEDYSGAWLWLAQQKAAHATPPKGKLGFVCGVRMMLPSALRNSCFPRRYMFLGMCQPSKQAMGELFTSRMCSLHRWQLRARFIFHVLLLPTIPLRQWKGLLLPFFQCRGRKCQSQIQWGCLWTKDKVKVWSPKFYLTPWQQPHHQLGLTAGHWAWPF